MSLAARWRYAVRPGVPCSASGVYLVRTRCSRHAHGRRCASPRGSGATRPVPHRASLQLGRESGDQDCRYLFPCGNAGARDPRMRAAVWSPSASRAVQVGRYVNALLAAAGELWRFAPTILGGHKVEIDLDCQNADCIHARRLRPVGCPKLHDASGGSPRLRHTRQVQFGSTLQECTLALISGARGRLGERRACLHV